MTGHRGHGWLPDQIHSQHGHWSCSKLLICDSKLWLQTGFTQQSCMVAPPVMYVRGSSSHMIGCATWWCHLSYDLIIDSMTSHDLSQLVAWPYDQWYMYHQSLAQDPRPVYLEQVAMIDCTIGRWSPPLVLLQSLVIGWPHVPPIMWRFTTSPKSNHNVTACEDCSKHCRLVVPW